MLCALKVIYPLSVSKEMLTPKFICPSSLLFSANFDQTLTVI